MSVRNTLIGVGVVALAATVLAHHIAMPLSSAAGTEVLSVITFHPGQGVPNYRLAEGHEFDVPAGATFHVADSADASETIVLAGGLMTAHDVVETINSQSLIVRASEQNGHVVVEGVQGGDTAVVDLQDGVGGGLSALGLTPGAGAGTQDIHLELSIPLDETHATDHAGGFAHHPYIIVASTTPGVTQVGAQQVPFAFDLATTRFLRAAQFGLLQSFVGELNETEDASAVLPAGMLGQLFPQGLPSQLFLAFGVLSEGGNSVEFVSNPFTVNID